MPANCSELQMMLTNESELEFKAEDSICYDKIIAEVFNGTIQNIPKVIALACNEPENQTKSMFELNHIRKCCPEGKAYDVEHHKCRDILQKNTVEGLLRWLNVKRNSVYDVDIGLRCKREEFAVELVEGKFSFGVDGSVLDVAGKGRVPSEEWCVDRDYAGPMLVARVCTDDCANYDAYCLKKCCPIGYHFKAFSCTSFRSACVPDDDSILFDTSSYLDDLKNDYDDIADVVGLGIGIKCPAGKYGLNKSLEIDNHWLTRDGKLMGKQFEQNLFCFETFDWRDCPQNNIEVTAVGCFIPNVTRNFKFSAVANTLSAVFLLITVMVYCCLPELHNLHGRTVICHAGTMLVAYSCLARVQFDKVGEPALCKFLGYGIYFGFVAAFFWLNVMCFDIWWTFGSVRTVQSMRKASAERRRFAWYSLYAWGMTLLLTLIMFLLDWHHVSDLLDANIGRDHCWFSSVQNQHTDWPHYIFFVVPMGILTSVNLILWVLTARHCARVKSEVHRLQAGSVGDRAKSRFRIDRAKYLLTGKLWVVMGAGWISELISTLFSEPQWLWSVVDLINELQGVFIFLLLVFKPKVYFLIKKRLGLVKPDAQNNGVSSGRTSSTFLSRTISSDERATLRVSLPNNDIKNEVKRA
uniref:G-protein coupled receptors family 2 profile 2 domain-containing protein n=2 Tax=Pectinophora gossypiella TaxID=13191 RepID=A0A1E1WU03_PECGO